MTKCKPQSFLIILFSIFSYGIGVCDGAFRDDYEYVNDLGDLDECNSMTIDGVYGYFVTDLPTYLQGVTEFLPISSSAHLLLPAELLGWVSQGLAFDAAVHVGSLLTVIIYMRKEIISMTTGFLNMLYVDTRPFGSHYPVFSTKDQLTQSPQSQIFRSTFVRQRNAFSTIHSRSEK